MNVTVKLFAAARDLVDQTATVQQQERNGNVKGHQDYAGKNVCASDGKQDPKKEFDLCGGCLKRFMDWYGSGIKNA